MKRLSVNPRRMSAAEEFPPIYLQRFDLKQNAEDFELVEEEDPDIIDQKTYAVPDLALYISDLETLKSKSVWAEEYDPASLRKSAKRDLEEQLQSLDFFRHSRNEENQDSDANTSTTTTTTTTTTTATPKKEANGKRANGKPTPKKEGNGKGPEKSVANNAKNAKNAKDVKGSNKKGAEAKDQTEKFTPRNRLYFNLHPLSSPKDQDFKCAGCANALSPGLFSTIRYCEYTGQYYCGNCHKKDEFVIPARILHNWDHRLAPVSVHAKQFLQSIYEEPLFAVDVINPRIYSISSSLSRIKLLRKQLFYLKDFVLTCRDRADLGRVLQDRMYLATESHELLESLRNLVEKYVRHVGSCDLCRMRGSICEFCHSKTPVYPFQLKTALQCIGPCKGIYHRACYVKEKCPKCFRIAKRSLEQRQQELQQQQQQQPLQQNEEQQVSSSSPNSLTPPNSSPPKTVPSQSTPPTLQFTQKFENPSERLATNPHKSKPT